MGSCSHLYIVCLFAVCLSLAVNTSAFALRSNTANSTYASPYNSTTNGVYASAFSPSNGTARIQLILQNVTSDTEDSGSWTTETESNTETPIVGDSTGSVYDYESESDAAYLVRNPEYP